MSSSPWPAENFTLAIIHAKLWTGLKHQDLAADAIGVRGENIALVGDSLTVLSRCDQATLVIDARQGMVVPGFSDCHCHFLDGGLRLLAVQLREVKTPADFAQAIAQKAAELAPGSWIMGGDWDHQQWGGSLPDKSWIDALTPLHPVWLNRLDGHMSLANSLALKLAGINSSTPSPGGGEIVRNEKGEPSGVFKDSAQNLIISHIPRRSSEENDRAVHAAMNYVAAHGVTEVHTMVTVDCACGLWPKNLGANAVAEDMEAAYEELAVYRRFHRQGLLKTRIRAALPLASWRRLRDDLEANGGGDDWLRLGCLKAMLDGSLGSHTAAMHEAYEDTPGYRGQFIWDPEILAGYIREASAAGLQVMVHAIGDRAIHEQLNMFERVARDSPQADHRFRIEHAQHIASEDIPRFARLGVIASLQMSHLADDGQWAEQAIGRKRLASSWPMKSLITSGARVALGSDWFVTRPSPLEGIHAAVSRATKDGKHPQGLIPEEKVSVEEALHGYTTGAAYASFAEHRRGSIEAGKLADLVLLDRDLRTIATEEIPQVQVLRTIIGGRVVFEKSR